MSGLRANRLQRPNSGLKYLRDAVIIPSLSRISDDPSYLGNIETRIINPRLGLISGKLFMDIDAFLGLVSTRRSARHFKDSDVPQTSIEKMLEAARWAMSGANAQPWEFVVVRNDKLRRQIAESWLEPNLEAEVIEQTRLPEIRRHNPHAPSPLPGFRTAPVLIVIVGDKRTYQATILAANFLGTEGAADAIYFKNMANATQLLHLAAAALGLGSEWISVNRLWGQTLKQILGIPEMLDVHTVVAVGYPAYAPTPPTRRPREDLVHYDKYDGARTRSAQNICDFLGALQDSGALVDVRQENTRKHYGP